VLKPTKPQILSKHLLAGTAGRLMEIIQER